jgi:hypothetical protein
MTRSLKKGVAVPKKATAKATRTPLVLSPKQKRACLSKATKTPSSHRTTTPDAADSMAVDSVNEIEGNDGDGIDDDVNDESELGALSV